MSKNAVVLASGVVIGVATLYAVKKKITVEQVLDYFEENTDVFNNLITNLLEVGMEILEKLASIVQRIVKELVFKYKMIQNELYT